ncbi:MAG: FAD-linked oxidase C-terminal domain-containing protein [bacterium]
MTNSRPDLLLETLTRLLGPERCLTDAATRAVYALDASRIPLGSPLVVTLPHTPDELATIISLCVERQVPWVMRGAGTGLSGGAVPGDGSVVVSTAGLDSVGLVRPASRLIRVDSGVRNETVSRIARPHGLQFAPDPSSQSASTIGGNVAENAGGPHCLQVGVTLHHVAGLEWVDPHGRRWFTGRSLSCERGLDLLALLTGSEGCLGCVTSADLQLIPLPTSVATLLAFFPELRAATQAVVDLLGAGLLPSAVEIVDQAVLQAVEEAFHFGFPTDVAAAMIVEIEGVSEAVAEDTSRTEVLLRQAGASRVRQAADETERQELWTCRKKAFGAVGRITPNYVTMDVVVPLGRLPDLVDAIGEIVTAHGVRIVTAFHAGDGNLHPGVMYDARDPDSTARGHAAADAIVQAVLQRGGSITGEHGVGLEKKHVFALQIDRVAGRLMADMVALFDPAGLCNPGKVLPPLAELTLVPPPPPNDMDFQWDSLTVTASAGTTLAAIQTRALERGYWIPVGAVRTAKDGSGLGAAGRVVDLVDQLLAGPSLLGRCSVRDVLLEIWAETGDGAAFHAGAPLFKNVAGFDLVHLFCGAAGMLGRLRAATFQLRPLPETAALWSFHLRDGVLSPDDLWRLLDRLRTWDRTLSAPTCIIDGFDVGSRGVTVLAAGRDRPWDLDRKQQELRHWAETAGLEFSHETRRPFAGLVELLVDPGLPVWSRHSPDWTSLARLPDHEGWPEFLATGRTIWQGAPELLWMPLAFHARETGWHIDTLFRAGEVTELPPPADTVPIDLLRRLKDLFDPQGLRGEPKWLERTREAAP